MLEDMKDHGDDSNEPPSHGNNTPGWNNGVFTNKLETPIGEKSINDVMSGISASLDIIGIISMVNQESSFEQDVAAIADGTILKPVENIAQQETQNLTFEGLQTNLELSHLPGQLLAADNIGGFKHGAEQQSGQSAGQTAMFATQRGG
jgi:hypothetical protein